MLFMVCTLHVLVITDGGSLYLVNCSLDLDLCDKHHITGFPTLVVFRGFGWLEGSGCIRNYMEAIRLDYHGILLVGFNTVSHMLIFLCFHFFLLLHSEYIADMYLLYTSM